MIEKLGGVLGVSVVVVVGRGRAHQKNTPYIIQIGLKLNYKGLDQFQSSELKSTRFSL